MSQSSDQYGLALLAIMTAQEDFVSEYTGNRYKPPGIWRIEVEKGDFLPDPNWEGAGLIGGASFHIPWVLKEYSARLGKVSITTIPEGEEQTATADQEKYGKWIQFPAAASRNGAELWNMARGVLVDEGGSAHMAGQEYFKQRWTYYDLSRWN